MNRRTSTPTLAGLAALVLVAGACSRAGLPAPGTVSPASDVQKPATTPGPTATTGPVAVPPGADVTDLLVLRKADPAADATYAVIDPGSRRVLFEIPDGLVSRDWRTLVSLTADGGSTRVEVTNPEGGDQPVRIAVAGAWRLPTIGVAHQASGLSADGRTLVLEEAVASASAGAQSRTRLAIVATAGSKAPRIVTLAGSFAFDALSPDGQWLYVIEHLPGADPTHYNVRRLDVASGRLQDGTIIDKRNIGEQMNGYAETQATGPDGWVYTVYRGADGAFIHALHTPDGVAYCIDLPGAAGEDAPTGAAWGLVADTPHDALYVVDPTRNAVIAVDLGRFSVRRTASLATAPIVQFAKLESAQPVTGRAALNPDGTTLYVADATGVAVVRVADLATIGHLGGSGVFQSLAVGSAGTVYAVDDAGRAMQLGNGSTAPIPVADGRYAAIVALVPIR